ncbi:MAG TPA: hypothetical protein VE547_05320 [Mycobacteriales bacterium]|jgi:hypothetical protein|nr:hypothetical protein [Mycobacteriales bacterium]
MRWLPDRRAQSNDVAERLTPRGLFRVDRDSASLSDRGTVQTWLRELHQDSRQQVFIHRPWGTIVADTDRQHPVTVILFDGEKSWVATAPGAGERQALTPEQVEHIMLDALTADSRPQWPDWHYLI